MSLKSKLWFIYRWIIWIKDNLIDNPKIYKNIKSFSLWKTLLWHDINCYKFGEWKEKILYFWGIHWNEVWTVKLMNKWINCLNKDIQNINKQVFIIPSLNIDWYKKAIKNPDYFNWWGVWKTNENIVDLNRNFPTSNWSKETKLFVSWKYLDVSWWDSPGTELEIKALLNIIKSENIETVYVYHNCWGTAMWTFTNSSDRLVREYSNHSWYNIYTRQDWDKLLDWQKTWHGTQWGIENDINFIEIELKTRWWSEWMKNKKALINTLK